MPKTFKQNQEYIVLPDWTMTREETKRFFIGFATIIIPGTILLYFVFKPQPICNLWWCMLPLITFTIVIGVETILIAKAGFKNIREFINANPFVAGSFFALLFIILNYTFMRQG